MWKRIKSLTINIALLIYNIITFISINILIWANHVWRPRKWTKAKIPNE